jgi:hypothetical protein
MKPCQTLDTLGLVAAVSCWLVATGCASPGDGVTVLKQPTTFPIVISQPGSYRLGSNTSCRMPTQRPSESNRAT